MKAFGIFILVAGACVLLGQSAQAQYKGPRDYFPKSFPPPAIGGAAATNSQAKPPAATGQQPKFKDLPVSAGFYFLTDTNRSYLWTKISATNAKNTKNGVVQAISGDIPVRR